MASTPSKYANAQPSRGGIVIDPAITLWLLIAAGGAWQIGASLSVRGVFVGLLTLAAVGLSFAASRRLR